MSPALKTQVLSQYTCADRPSTNAVYALTSRPCCASGYNTLAFFQSEHQSFSCLRRRAGLSLARLLPLFSPLFLQFLLTLIRSALVSTASIPTYKYPSPGLTERQATAAHFPSISLFVCVLSDKATAAPLLSRVYDFSPLLARSIPKRRRPLSTDDTVREPVRFTFLSTSDPLGRSTTEHTHWQSSN